MYFLRLMLSGAFLWSAATTFGHGDLHAQIASATAKIEQSPDDPQLYFERGSLYFLHEDWDQALADLELAEQAVEPQKAIDLLRAKIGLSAGLFHYGLVHIDRYLKKVTSEPQGWLVRARLLVKLEKPAEAVTSYNKAIDLMKAPSPDCYIERARAYGMISNDDALRSLDEAIMKLGPIINLEQEALDIEIKLKQFDDAVQRVDQIIARMPNKELWLMRKAEILEEAGDSTEAMKIYAEVRALVSGLPGQRQNTPAMQELLEKARDKLEAK